MGIIHRYDKFEAFCDHEPGPGGPSNVLTVSGAGSFIHGGCTAELVESSSPAGTGTDLLLDLVLTPPAEGSGYTQEVEGFEVGWSGDGHSAEGSLQYEHVRFRVVGTDDDPPLTIDVQPLG